MSLDADAIVDRRRLRRKLTFWRVSAVVDRARGGRRRRPACWRRGSRLFAGRRLHRPRQDRRA